jgi:hypothetical protein
MFYIQAIGMETRAYDDIREICGDTFFVRLHFMVVCLRSKDRRSEEFWP